MIITDDLGGVWGEARRSWEKLGKSRRGRVFANSF